MISPWERHSFDVETGILWQVGDNTPIDYQLVQTQFSWRSPYVFKWDIDGGSTVVVRNHASLIGTWMKKGRKIILRHLRITINGMVVGGRDAIVYFSIGGGFGIINSTMSPLDKVRILL